MDSSVVMGLGSARICCNTVPVITGLKYGNTETVRFSEDGIIPLMNKL
jgi:hypothetical protein